MKRISQGFKVVSLYLLISVFTLFNLLPAPALAQQLLPHPEDPFGGKIGLTYEDSVADKAKLPMPQNYGIENPPNILIVLVDDAGYGQFSTFGGGTPTPTLDYLADNGLKYTQFHTTALCAPTRSALLTGHNHHSASNGALPESGTGYPGYSSIIPNSTATIGKVLHEYGYDTSWFGKNHNVPQWETSLAGPFDHWPTNLGFDYFYGFVGGSTDQYHPASLVENTTRLEPPSTNADGSPYHLSTDLADHTIDYLRKLNAVAPQKPFFTYFATGATHAPHQVPPEWIGYIQDPKNGAYDFSKGWDQYRKDTFEKQKELGVVPQDADLTPRPCSLQPWEKTADDQCYTLPGNTTKQEAATEDERQVYQNMMEVFSAFTAHTDNEISRVIQEIDDMGKLDNTLVFYIAGDNGSSAEGELGGLLNELSVFNQIEEPFWRTRKAVKRNQLGTDKHYNHFPAAWAWAMNTPFQWTKQIASHFGGTRNGMVVSWPNGIDKEENGGTRYQFAHVIDIMPTILEAVGISAPVEVDGIAQKPLEGNSFFKTFNDSEVKSDHTTQYFELFGNQGIYSDGWMASAIRSIPWEPDPLPNDLLDMPWELYCIKDCTPIELNKSEAKGKIKEIKDSIPAINKTVSPEIETASTQEHSIKIDLSMGIPRVKLVAPEINLPQSKINVPQPEINLPGSNCTGDSCTIKVKDDYTQAHDLAKVYPEKLDEMVKLFFAQASLYNVLPLDDRKIERYDVALRPNWIEEGRNSFTYPDRIRVTEGAIPDVRNKFHTITADVSLEKGDSGMLATFGGRFAGYGFYVDDDGHLVYCYNLADKTRYYIKSDKTLDDYITAKGLSYPIDAQLQVVYEPTDVVNGSPKYKSPASVTLYASLEGAEPVEIGSGTVEESLLSRFTIDETFDVGYDTGTPVNEKYKLPFDFTGTLNNVTIELN